jgi:uncharacterized lipoprotein YmbA
MTRHPLMIVAALMLGACASNSPAPARALAQMTPTDPAIIAKVKAEREAVTKVYVVCLLQAAKKLDDHKSDPATIAQAMLSACAVEFNRQVIVYRVGDMTLEQMDRILRKDTLGQAIEIVLKNRKGMFR